MRKGTFKKPIYAEYISKQQSKKRSVKPKKVSKIKVKAKKVKVSTLKKKLWEKTKLAVREKYLDHRGYVNCYTCDKLLTEKKDMHTAHFLPSASCGAYLRYDMRNLRICCYNCNVNLGGNGAEYYRRMVNEMGQEHVDQIFKDKQKVIQADTQWYLNKLSS